MAGLDLATRVSTANTYDWDAASGSRLLAVRATGAMPARAALSRGRLRFRHQAQHPAAPGACRAAA